MRLLRFGLVTALAIHPHHTLEAQRLGQLGSAFDVGALVQREGPGLWEPSTHMASAVRLDQRFVRLGVDGSLIGTNGTLLMDRGAADLNVSPAAFGPFRLNVGARAERMASLTLAARSLLSVESSISFANRSSGVWVGTALERGSLDEAKATQPLLRAGLWKQFGGAVITVSTASRSARLAGKSSTFHNVSVLDSVFNDTTKGYNYFQRSLTFGDSGTSARTRLWSELTLNASWSRGPLALDAALGARPEVDAYPRALWAHVAGVLQVTPGLAMIASGGNDPARIMMGTPQTRIASLGFRVSTHALLRPPPPAPIRPAAAVFELRQLGANSWTVSIRVPKARTVELSGDFGKWVPVALEQVRPDVWEATLTLPPGTYRMNLRVDGDRWRAPPGMATADDEFNGTVGILIVR